MAREKYCTRHYLMLYFEMLACMSISLSLTTAFTLNTLYFTIIFIEFECIL